MAAIMTKQGNLDNVVTYEHICDTFEDIQTIDPHYITLGSTCVVINGESGGLEVYMANSNKEWESLSVNSGSSGESSSLPIQILSADDIDEETGEPNINTPVENTFYLTPSSEEGNDMFDEWIYINDGWEKFGSGGSFNADWNAGQDEAGYINNKPSIKAGSGALSIEEGTLSSNQVTFKEPDNITEHTYIPGAHSTGSHVEGNATCVENNQTFSHAEGNCTIVLNGGPPGGHAEGCNTVSYGAAHAEGYNTVAKDMGAHSEGNRTLALKFASHAEGNETKVSSNYGHAEGLSSKVSGLAGHAEGIRTEAKAEGNHAEGVETIANSQDGKSANTSSFGAHAEGYKTQALDTGAHAEGSETISKGIGAHTEGIETQASANGAHAEGTKTISKGLSSHAEGESNERKITVNNQEIIVGAYGDSSHVEGIGTYAGGNYSHAENNKTEAHGFSSHAEGILTKANGESSHAEGIETVTNGQASHTSGIHTIASGKNQFVFGRGNVEDITFAEIVGNGQLDNYDNLVTRSNARTLDWSGNQWLAGNLTLNQTTLTENNLIELLNSRITEITISDTDVIITANNNTRYICGEVSTLDFTPSATGICDIRFTSGSQKTILTLPNTVKMPDWFEVEANMTYEISIADGVYGVVTSWAV